jgi:ubiquinone/menaquinone biosynthesis C-methylase UbiE
VRTSVAWRLFERVAGQYDQVIPFFASYGASIMSVLSPSPGCRFLDLGAGRGALSAAALERGCQVVAVDAAPTMVARLVDHLPSAYGCVMDAQALALADGCVDLVAAAFVLHLLPAPTGRPPRRTGCWHPAGGSR